MKKLAILLAFLLLLPMGACSQEGGGTMANYLYNGVELPDINEVWDKETYPYAAIQVSAFSGYRLILLDSPVYRGVDNDGSLGCFAPANTSREVYSQRYNPDAMWDFYSDNSNSDKTEPSRMGTIFWTSHDILNEDGTVYLEASIPILADSKLSVSVKTAAEGKMFYNDRELQPLPEMTEEQKEQYPYLHSAGDSWIFALSDVNYTIASDYITAPATWSLSRNPKCLIVAYDTTSGRWTTDYWMEVENGYGPDRTFVGTKTTVSIVKWANFDVLNEDGTVFLHASEPSAYGADFTCSDLLSTETVYQVKAWCYPKGMDYWTAPVTWESGLFAGTEQTVSATFPNLLPGTEYEVYACIYADGKATEHNAHTTFTTAASEEETPQAVVLCNQVTENSFTAWLLATGLDSSKEYTAVFEAFENDVTSTGHKTLTFSDSVASQSCAFTGLKPNTDYVVYVDLYLTDGGERVFTGECAVTTLEGEIVSGYDRDSFLLGFASGLGCTAATKDGAEYNSWTQGYIVGSALRKAL